MEKFRVINTKFWDDPWVMDLDPIEKLLFLYLLSNSHTTLAGIYELHIRKMAFETGIDREMIEKILARFQDDNKVIYKNGWLLIVNFTKNQKYNPSMLKNIENVIHTLPEWMLTDTLYTTCIQVIDTLYTPHAQKEKEKEKEKEEEEESKSEIPAWEDFKNYALENDSNIDIKALELKYNAWKENDWMTGGDKPHKIKNWKSTLLHTIPHMIKGKLRKEFTEADFEDGNGKNIYDDN